MAYDSSGSCLCSWSPLSWDIVPSLSVPRWEPSIQAILYRTFAEILRILVVVDKYGGEGKHVVHKNKQHKKKKQWKIKYCTYMLKFTDHPPGENFSLYPLFLAPTCCCLLELPLFVSIYLFIVSVSLISGWLNLSFLAFGNSDLLFFNGE